MSTTPEQLREMASFHEKRCAAAGPHAPPPCEYCETTSLLRTAAEELERMRRDHEAMERLRQVGERVELMGDMKWEYLTRWGDPLSVAGDPADAILGTDTGSRDDE